MKAQPNTENPMTCITDVSLDFADGRYRFWIGLPQARELEQGGMTMLLY